MNEVRAAAAPDDDWLEAALRDDGREFRGDYVSDDGFTARVAAALPAPVTLPAWRKPALLGLWAAGGLGAAVSFPGAFAEVTREIFRVVAGHPIAIADIAVGITAVAMLTLAAAAWALRDE